MGRQGPQSIQDTTENLNQVYLVSAAGDPRAQGQVHVLPLIMEFAEITADRFALAGVAEISAGRFALASVAVDFNVGEEWELRRILLIQFGLEHGR